MDNYMVILMAIGLGSFIAIIFMRVMMMFDQDSNSEYYSPSSQYSNIDGKQYNNSIKDLHKQANKVFDTVDDMPDFDEACIDYMEVMDAEELHDDKQIN